MEWLHAGIWLLVSIAMVAVVALEPGWIMFIGSIVGVIAQVFGGRLIMARLKKQ